MRSARTDVIKSLWKWSEALQITFSAKMTTNLTDNLRPREWNALGLTVRSIFSTLKYSTYLRHTLYRQTMIGETTIKNARMANASGNVTESQEL